MKVKSYLIETAVADNIIFEVGFFEGVLAALGITDYDKGYFTASFRSYTFVTTEENDALITKICTEKEIHFRKANVEIRLS